MIWNGLIAEQRTYKTCTKKRNLKLNEFVGSTRGAKIDMEKLSAASLHVQWLREQIRDKKEQLIKVKADLEYFERCLNEVLPQSQRHNPSAPSDGHRGPKDMLAPEFSDKSILAAAILVLDGLGSPATPEEIAAVIFRPTNKDEAFRCWNALSSELRRGAKEGKIGKLGRGLFASNGVTHDRQDQKGCDRDPQRSNNRLKTNSL